MVSDNQNFNRRFGSLAWGAFFILLGVSALLRLPNGTNLFGIGIILLALNAARALNGLRVCGFTLTLGVIALGLGAMDLLRAFNIVTTNVPTLPILLIAIGAMWLARGLRRS
ncbi:MAG: hypothetical protein HY070_10795 [Chloroflexi bacterium]|nr:hypothetical protein [Chloroflexota bacterium]